jgi:hypothetical protein
MAGDQPMRCVALAPLAPTLGQLVSSCGSSVGNRRILLRYLVSLDSVVRIGKSAAWVTWGAFQVAPADRRAIAALRLESVARAVRLIAALDSARAARR